jgi:hypothetical protein
MTTIAYHRGLFAVDRGMSLGGRSMVGSIRKMHFSPCGAVGAITGSAALIGPFSSWMRNRFAGDPPALEEGDAILIVTHEGMIRAFEPGGWFEPDPDQPFTAGSGGTLALAAIRAGADAVRAVEIACAIDPFSATPIDFAEVPQPKPVLSDAGFTPNVMQGEPA